MSLPGALGGLLETPPRQHVTIFTCTVIKTASNLYFKPTQYLVIFYFTAKIHPAYYRYSTSLVEIIIALLESSIVNQVFFSINKYIISTVLHFIQVHHPSGTTGKVSLHLALLFMQGVT